MKNKTYTLLLFALCSHAAGSSLVAAESKNNPMKQAAIEVVYGCLHQQKSDNYKKQLQAEKLVNRVLDDKNEDMERLYSMFSKGNKGISDKKEDQVSDIMQREYDKNNPQCTAVLMMLACMSLPKKPSVQNQQDPMPHEYNDDQYRLPQSQTPLPEVKEKSGVRGFVGMLVFGYMLGIASGWLYFSNYPLRKM